MWSIKLTSKFTAFSMALLLVGAPAAQAQDRMTEWGLSGLAPGKSVHPRFELEYLRPEVHRWYAPRNLVESYMRPWYFDDAGYGQKFYQRYIDRLLEGQEWYDTFGRRLGQGWFVYSWEQEQARRNGSLLRKKPGATGTSSQLSAYSAFFQNLVIAADGDGRGSYRLMVGDEIYTRFTPLTFFKPRFDGIRLDYAADRYVASLIMSRPSQPNASRQNNATHLMGGHTSFQLTEAARLGFTYVNAHNVLTQRDFSFGNPMYGSLTSDQNQPLQKLWVRIRDDSPFDLESGATLFDHEIVLVDTAGQELRGREIGLLPRIEGGRRSEGALVVEGSETLLLEYDLQSLDFEGTRSAAISQAWVELSIANDYHVEMASNLQTDGERRDPETVFLSLRRATGNVKDDSNSRMLKLDYGLPTGNELIGMNWDLVEWKGLSLQGEAVLNRHFRRYPSLVESRHHLTVERAHAAYATAAYDHYSWGLFAEAFSMADDYSSRYWLVKTNGLIRYKAPIPELYEFVEDDDDHNGIPEWVRPFQDTTREVAWPGYDENGDFIYDHNQNANLIPDYEEPFLRFRSDRPEFLAGLDMNHNGHIDRFENDREADYPYRRDHQGFNAYASASAGPDMRLILGLQRMRLIAGDGSTRALYGLWTWIRDLPSWGRLRLFEFGALIKDDIPDDLYQWAQPLGARGRMREVVDRLPAQNTWKNLLYADLDQRLGKGVRLLHRCKWELLAQRDNQEELFAREGRRWSGFLGVIDKVEWSIPIGLGSIEPRFKSEFRRDRPYSTRLPRATSLEETGFLLWIQPLLSERTSVNYFSRYGRQLFDTELQVGVELSRFWMLEGRREEIDQDFRSWAVVVQFVNRVGYQGYRLVTRAGMQWNRRDLEQGEKQRTSMLFLTINAGLQ